MQHVADSEIRPLLVEIFTEELPPKALRRLGEAFALGIQTVLEKQGLLAGTGVTPYATPRRLAVLFDAVRARAADQPFVEKLMPAKIGLDANGEPTPALAKKLAAKGLGHLKAADLERESDGKQDYLLARGVAPGTRLEQALQEALESALAGLPIPKMMRYQLADGVTSVRFVRPAHALIALFGDDVVPVEALGLKAGRQTQGHRFMCAAPLTLATATGYESLLAESGRVVAAFDTRRDQILEQLRSHALRLGASLGPEQDVTPLLDEVTALVEHPTVYVGQFEEAFLAVPQECLILTMRLNQKYFPLFDAKTGTLTHQFLIVSNMQPANPVNIIEGNQRVVRPRLADAQFFFDTDRKTPLVERLKALETIVYHNKLGTQFARAERLAKIAGWIARSVSIGHAQQEAFVTHAQRAALLAKADLSTNMVGEFPELQGIMGAYYAAHDGEDPTIVAALRSQYQIRLDTAVTPDSLAAAALFMADRAEVLIGIWGIGLTPSGDRDPFGLRRAALGLISAFEQLAAGQWLPVGTRQAGAALTLRALLTHTADTFAPGTLSETDVLAQVEEFVLERYRNQLLADAPRTAVEAVIELARTPLEAASQPQLQDIPARVQAVAAFAQLPEAASLAAANKRVGNLLKKAGPQTGDIDTTRLVEPAEKALDQALKTVAPAAQAAFAQGDFSTALRVLAQLREPVDAFFADVMVMAEDPALRANRLRLLDALYRCMNQVADISRLDT